MREGGGGVSRRDGLITKKELNLVIRTEIGKLKMVDWNEGNDHMPAKHSHCRHAYKFQDIPW